MQKLRGFSLLEVIVVLAIVGLMMGVVAANLNEGPILRNAAQELATSLRHARSVAILRQRETVWAMDTSAKLYWLEGHPQKHQLSDGISPKINTATREVISTHQANIRFYPDGSSTGGSVELTVKGETYRINVEWISGRVSTR